MKKRLLVALSLLFCLQVSAQVDPVIMEIDGKKVTKSEFLQIYLKNNNDPKYDQKSLDDYMELFKKFKLKVAEAEALGYDTIPKLKKELAGYRKQLSQPYLVDSSQNKVLIDEAYARMKTEVRASHILIKVDENATPEDTLRAYNKLMALRKRILAGEDFATVAKSKGGSDDKSAEKNGGDLGYFTAFQMVYPFEEAAYKTAIGNVSMPVRTRFGYHIIKVVDQRPARGTMKAAHIMISVLKDAPQDEVESAQKKVNEIYAKIQAGESFADLAKEYSDDTQSGAKGGELPNFGTGTTTRMVTEFEEAAFALKADGDVSQPIRTDFGYHIIKRIQLVPLRSYDELKKEIQTKVNKDERAMITQNSFIKKLKKSYKFKDSFKKTNKVFMASLDSNYFKGKWSAANITSNKPMFTLGKQAFTQQQFAMFLEKNYRGTKPMDIKSLVTTQYANWQKSEILAYEESRLETKYPEFKALMKEYHDGILLYEVMTDKVWNKGIKDTTGLKDYFAKNNGKYAWGQRYDSYVYECKNQEIANKVTAMLNSSDTISSKTILATINKDSELNLKVRTGKLEADNTPYLKGQALTTGINKSYVYEDKVYVVKVAQILKPTQKTLSEAKGPATSDYQSYLEQEWLAEIAKKHPIVVNKEILYSLGK